MPRAAHRAEKDERRTAVNAFKRDLIREAARRLFARRGLPDTSVREIAKAAGYTTGAIYFHYASKEEIYADVLRDSLTRLHADVRRAADAEPESPAGIAQAFRALVAFYRINPSDLDLGLYLFQGMRPRGLTAELDRDLNARLMAVLDIFRDRLQASGVPSDSLVVWVAALFDEMIGLLVVSHTGRLKVLGADHTTMLEHHVAQLLVRLRTIDPAA